MNKKIIGLLVVIVVLTGCDQKPRVGDIDTKVDETIVQIDEGDYKTIVPQPTSAVRGVANNTIDTDLDLDEMETGLMNISKDYASTKKYIYQPGTIITSDEAYLLVGREFTSGQYQKYLELNPNAENIGLNLPLESRKSGESAADYDERQKDNKIYVNTIIEQDYFTYDDAGNKKIEKVAIGFGMDPTYTYKDANGKVVTINIENKELNEFANSYIANKMTKFIRSKEGYENVDLIYGFFKESETEMYPGTYYAQAEVKAGEDNIQNIKRINNQYMLFPTDEGEEFDSDLNSGVDELEKEIRGYFPYNTGAYARGYYEEGSLKNIYIRLNVNVYSQVDLIPFVNFIEEKINEKLTQKVDITVDIRRSSGEAEAIMNFDKNRNVQKYIY